MALIDAASKGDVERVKRVLASGTSVDFADVSGRTALHHATKASHTSVVDLLLR